MFLQLSDTVFSLIWTTTPDNAKQLMELSDETFVNAVNDALVSKKCNVKNYFLLKDKELKYSPV